MNPSFYRNLFPLTYSLFLLSANKCPDPLSIAAGIVGLIVPALHGTRLLLDDLRQLNEAPKAIKRLVDDVHSVDIALKLLQAVEDREWDLLGAGIAEHSKTTISSCTLACKSFQNPSPAMDRTFKRWQISMAGSNKCGIL